MEEVLQCKECGKSFERRSKRGVAPSCCSPKCRISRSERSRKAAPQETCEVCGDPFTPARAGRGARFCSRECRSLSSRKPVGHISNAPNGYKWVVVPQDHPYGIHLSKRSNTKVILHHRYVMEQTLGRYLNPRERVHHKNGRRDDNRPENLELWTLDHKDPPGVRSSDLEQHCPTCTCGYGHQVE